MKIRTAAVACLFLITLPLAAQDDADMAFDIKADVDPAVPSVTLTWELTSYNRQVNIQRKLKGEKNFGSPVSLPENTSRYTDANVQKGKTYEYYVYSSSAREYIAVAVEAPLIDYRGKVLLIIEESLSSSLSQEINRLKTDIRGDGWQVVEQTVSSAASVSTVRTLIQQLYAMDPVNTKALFILGRVAQPLSGCLAPDGHGDHVGAWATDMYYADIDGTWTDATASCSGTWNANVPGDGKWDQNALPSPAELQTGRVDLSNLPAFSESYTDLTRRYLLKNHLFRHKQINPPRKALVLDFFHWGFAWSGYYYFNAVFGKSFVKKASTSDFTTSANLWGYACAAGESDGFVQAGWHTSDFAKKNYSTVFTMLFGSYFGDYQMSNNFMRGALASRGWILSCSWSGRPVWVYHHMATGETIGYTALVNMNNKGEYYGSYNRAVQIDLLGDPTLRQDMIAPPRKAQASLINHHIKITWSPSDDSIEGYHIYKASGLDSVYVRLTPVPLKDTSWTDPDSAGTGFYYYQIKSFRMEKGRCGSYANTSTGILVTNDSSSQYQPVMTHKPYVINRIPDQTGYVKKSFYYTLPLSSTFADEDPEDIETLVYEIYKADSNALPAGWYFSPLGNFLSVSPLPAKPIRFNVVVKATDMTGNFATDTFEINIIDPAQISSNTMNEADLYPNPASGRVCIKFSTEENDNGILALYGDKGELLHQQTFHASPGINEITLSVEEYASGIYFLEMTTSKTTYVKKLIIEK